MQVLVFELLIVDVGAGLDWKRRGEEPVEYGGEAGEDGGVYAWIVWESFWRFC